MSQRGKNSLNRGRRRYHRPPPQKRSPLNCIVDEGALIAGLADATDPADSLKAWIREGAINVYVPLYTLEKLNMLRSSPPPLNLNARKTLEWLDQITSLTESKTAGHVELQGPDDQYQTWQEVEKYLLPETPLSANDVQSNVDEITDTIEEDMSIHDNHSLAPLDTQRGGSPPNGGSLAGSASPSASPMTNFLNPSAMYGTNHARGFSESSALSISSAGGGLFESTTSLSIDGTANIPSRIRPLLNYVVWRTHHEDPASESSGKYILLTNDPNTRKQAQQFGVRAKLLSQLRFIVARDRKRSSNQTPQKGSASKARDINPQEAHDSVNHNGQDGNEEGEEDEVVFKPKRPNSGQLSSPTPDVWDPDHFGREPLMHSAPAQAVDEPESSGRGNSHARGSTRGRGQSRPFRQRDSQRGRGSMGANPQKRYEKTIDPDSFARPPPQGRRGRGSFRRLWEPDG